MDQPSTAAVASRWRYEPCSMLAVLHAVPHGVVSQIHRPDVAAFLPDTAVATRTHVDALRSVDTVTCLRKTPAVGEDDVDFLAQFPHLTALSMSGYTCDIDGPIGTAALSEVADKLPQLESLDLSSCRGIDAGGLAPLATLACLHTLSLGGTEVDAAMCAEVGKLRTLQHLRLISSPGLDAAGLMELLPLKAELRTLNLGGCSGVDAAGLAAVGRLDQLHTLVLSDCGGVDAAGLAEVAKLKHLRTLHIDGCRGVNVACLTEVAKMQRLQVLNVRSCRVLSAEALFEIATLSDLQELDVSECWFDPAGYTAIAQLTQLRSLSLQFCRKVDRNIDSLLTLKNLRHLDLSKSRGALRFRIKDLAISLPRLERLALRHCDIPDAPAFSLFKKLKVLDLRRCGIFGPEFLSEITTATGVGVRVLSDS